MKLATEHLIKADPVLAELINRIGPCSLTLRQPTFETLARSITFQQLSGKAAGAIFQRVKKAAGRRFSAAAFLRLSHEELRSCGLSRQKVAALTDLAEHVVSRRIQFSKFPQMEDQQIIDVLSQVRGVGVWTVQMFLMFALERPNVLPLGDLGIRKAIRNAYKLEIAPKPSEIAAYGLKWHPYCSLACWYLWRSLDGPAGL